MFVDFLPDALLNQRRVIIAHGVQRRQDTVFLAYDRQFATLTEDDFTDFWCVYLISLAYEQFLRSDRHRLLLENCDAELTAFRQQYAAARIPEFDRKKTLRETLGWTLTVVKGFKARVSFKVPGDIAQLELSFDGGSPASRKTRKQERTFMTAHIHALTASLEDLLSRANLSLWLMIDRLDEIFARRSKTEQKALRGLLHTLRYFRSDRIRVKVFLRDDILEEIVSPRGFTSLSHVSARKSDTLG